MSAPTIKFTARALAPVAAFMAKNEPRWYLNGICAEPNPNGVGCFVGAANGHHMAVWHDADGSCTERTVLRVSKELVSASRKKKANGWTINYEDGRLVLCDANEQEIFVQAGKARIDASAEYPNLWRAVPQESQLVPGLHGSINSRYLETIAKVGIMLEGQDGHGSGVWHYSNGADGLGSIATRFGKAENLIVITMPRRELDEIRRAGKLPADTRRVVATINKGPSMATANFACGSMGEEVAA